MATGGQGLKGHRDQHVPGGSGAYFIEGEPLYIEVSGSAAFYITGHQAFIEGLRKR